LLYSVHFKSNYLADVEKAAEANLGAWLQSNLISPAAFAAAKANDYDAFLTERASTIQPIIRSLAGW
jgi:hypothetical protein